MTDMKLLAVEALFDTLLPGDETYPAASAAGAVAALSGHRRFADTVDQVLESLPSGFAGMDEERRMNALEKMERSNGELFSALLVAAYSLYYTRQPVLDAIEATNGYSPRPPQPHGHALAPFDPAMLAVPAARAPHYRPTPETKDAN